MSAGYCMIIRIWFNSSSVTVVSRTETANVKYIVLATALRICSYCFAPKCRATGTAHPAQMPLINPRNKKVIEPVEPTAASASAPTKRPTITESAIL